MRNVLVLSPERWNFNETPNFANFFFRNFNENEVLLFFFSSFDKRQFLDWQFARIIRVSECSIEKKKKKKKRCHVKVLYRLSNKVDLASNRLSRTVDRPFITTCMRFVSDHSLLCNSSVSTIQLTHVLSISFYRGMLFQVANVSFEIPFVELGVSFVWYLKFRLEYFIHCCSELGSLFVQLNLDILLNSLRKNSLSIILNLS